MGLEQKIVSIDDVIHKYGYFFKRIFSSNFMRDGVPTIKSFIRKMKLEDKVCIRLVNAIEVGKFTVLDRYFGNLSQNKIFITHSEFHFFLVKNWTFKCQL